MKALMGLGDYQAEASPNEIHNQVFSTHQVTIRKISNKNFVSNNTRGRWNPSSSEKDLSDSNLLEKKREVMPIHRARHQVTIAKSHSS